MLLMFLKAASRAPAKKRHIYTNRTTFAPYTCAEQPDCLVDSSEWRHIHSLSANSSGSSDTRGVLPWTTVGYGIHQHLQWVLDNNNDELVRQNYKYMYSISLQRFLVKMENAWGGKVIPYLSCQQVEYLKRMFHDPHGHQLFSVVAAVHHQRVGQSLHNRTLQKKPTTHFHISLSIGLS